ncbi:LysR family transcriptional regulator [Microbulbifer halophilus]|uniref:LysR family transcriptional regulator n=1 Tax=Microbulbifer halophilus TaxID=453963 RepID=A0ABW5EGD8_9GAMM|nr:LysR family transcriptional regulator [Microbulbifer halophilus]MCW8128158.1 LysR family transcriptional regulator [Microbulbifer halophilus]
MAKDIGWELYRSFLGVLREGSLSAAARALGVTQPTVGRHIAALEKSFGLTLFVRSQGGLQPTQAAGSLRVHAEEMAKTAAALQRAAANQGTGVRGVVRVTASEVVGVEVLPAILTRLRNDFPELKLELVLSNRPQDLLHREADIAVRMFRPHQAQLVARRIGEIEVGLHAREDYLGRHGCPDHPQELAANALIGFDQQTDFIRRAARNLPAGFDRERFVLSADSDLAQLAMIRAGAGIGACQVPLASRDRRLVRVLPEHFCLPMETWVTMHEDLRNSAPCRAAFDALATGLQQYLAQD